MSGLERHAFTGTMTLMPVLLAAHYLAGSPTMVAFVLVLVLVLGGVGVAALFAVPRRSATPDVVPVVTSVSVEDVATNGLTEWAAARVRGGA